MAEGQDYEGSKRTGNGLYVFQVAGSSLLEGDGVGDILWRIFEGVGHASNEAGRGVVQGGLDSEGSTNEGGSSEGSLEETHVDGNVE